MRRLALILAIPLIFSGAAQVQAEGDFAQGQKLAREVCTSCHHVEVGGPAKQFPPSFASIAEYRSDEFIQWKLVLPPAHSGMESISHHLTPMNVDHLIAYITSLDD